MKKIKNISIFATCAIAVAALIIVIPFATGCNTEDAQWQQTADIPEPITDNSKIKIGVSIWSTTDVLGSSCKKIIDKAANTLGISVQYADHGNQSEKIVSSVEQLCAAGCQGVIICNSSDTEMITAVKTCNENSVYLAQFFRTLHEDNEQIWNYAKQSPFYLGCTHENENTNGRTLVKILLDRGDRNIGLIGWEQGDATWLGRWEGYKAGVEEWNDAHPNDQAKLSEPQYAGTTSDGGSKAADALMSADSTLDAIIPAGGGGDPLQGALAAIERSNKKGKIDVVSTDFLDDLEDRLADGSMTAESGGHFCDPLFSLLLTYGAIKGNYTDFADKIQEIEYPYIYVSSSKDYGTYKTYFLENDPFTDDEILEMSEMSLEDLTAKAATITLEDAEERYNDRALEDYYKDVYEVYKVLLSLSEKYDNLSPAQKKQYDKISTEFSMSKYGQEYIDLIHKLGYRKVDE